MIEPGRVSLTMRLVDDARARPFPVERIDVPENDAITKFIVDPLLLPRRDRAVGRPHQDGPRPDRRPDRVVRLLQLGAHAFVRHFAEGRMRPAVIADLVAFAHGPLQNLGMVAPHFVPMTKKVA